MRHLFLLRSFGDKEHFHLPQNNEPNTNGLRRVAYESPARRPSILPWIAKAHNRWQLVVSHNPPRTSLTQCHWLFPESQYFCTPLLLELPLSNLIPMLKVLTSASWISFSVCKSRQIKAKSENQNHRPGRSKRENLVSVLLGSRNEPAGLASWWLLLQGRQRWYLMRIYCSTAYLPISQNQEIAWWRRMDFKRIFHFWYAEVDPWYEHISLTVSTTYLLFVSFSISCHHGLRGRNSQARHAGQADGISWGTHTHFRDLNSTLGFRSALWYSLIIRDLAFFRSSHLKPWSLLTNTMMNMEASISHGLWEITLIGDHVLCRLHCPKAADEGGTHNPRRVSEKTDHVVKALHLWATCNGGSQDFCGT